MQKRFTLIAGLGLVAVLAASCSSSPSTGSASTKALLTKSQTAVTKAGSVHFVDVTKIGSKSETLTGDIGPTNSQEVLTVGGSIVLQVRLVQGTVYIETTAASVLQSALSLSSTTATAMTGKWISLTSTDAPASSITQSLTVSAALGIYYPKPAAAVTLPTKTVSGVTVIPITADSTPTTKTTETTTLFIAQSTTLPVTATLSAKSGSTTENKQAVFTQWGETVTVIAPVGATPYSSLAAG